MLPPLGHAAQAGHTARTQLQGVGAEAQPVIANVHGALASVRLAAGRRADGWIGLQPSKQHSTSTGTLWPARRKHGMKVQSIAAGTLTEGRHGTPIPILGPQVSWPAGRPVTTPWPALTGGRHRARSSPPGRRGAARAAAALPPPIRPARTGLGGSGGGRPHGWNTQ